MGISFWVLFAIQVLVLGWFYKVVFKVEDERSTESITPATDDDVEVF
jgi:hypothetical protein